MHSRWPLVCRYKVYVPGQKIQSFGKTRKTAKRLCRDDQPCGDAALKIMCKHCHEKEPAMLDIIHCFREQARGLGTAFAVTGNLCIGRSSTGHRSDMHISVALLVAGLGASRQRNTEMLEAAIYQMTARATGSFAMRDSLLIVTTDASLEESLLTQELVATVLAKSKGMFDRERYVVHQSRNHCVIAVRCNL